MKLKITKGSGAAKDFANAFKRACLTSSQNILAQIAAAKETIFAESFRAHKTQGHLLRLALNEAEAAAWQTMYPHLLFPELATEKVQALIAWDTQQQSILRSNPIYGVAV